jgi:3-deoxy-D-manno-octulosonate 8-phosphate phosphatase (KDO 8-P phosphatase)
LFAVSANSLDPRLRAVAAQVRLVAFDFDGVFTDNTVYVGEDGRETVRCCRSDGLGLAKLPALGVATIVISTEKNPVVSARCRKLGIRCIQDCADKRATLQAVIAETGLAPAAVAFVGNDINDSECLRLVGLPIVVADAHPEVVPLAAYQTHTDGGRGAVREVCDLIVAARAAS